MADIEHIVVEFTVEQPHGRDLWVAVVDVDGLRVLRVEGEDVDDVFATVGALVRRKRGTDA